MKNLFFLTLIFGLFPPINAESFCTLTSEEESDVTLEMNKPYAGWGYGTLNYKDKPAYYFEVGITNGYGGQYYQLKTFEEDALLADTRMTYSVRTKNTELISNGRFMNFVGDQLGRSTSKEERKSGKLRALMPTLPQDYYYSLTNNHKKGEYGRFNLSPKMKAILTATEGFFVDSGGCRNYFAYGWD